MLHSSTSNLFNNTSAVTAARIPKSADAYTGAESNQMVV